MQACLTTLRTKRTASSSASHWRPTMHLSPQCTTLTVLHSSCSQVMMMSWHGLGAIVVHFSMKDKPPTNCMTSGSSPRTFESMCRWYLRNHLQKYGGTPKSALTAYFLASANIFESGRAAERLAWARTWVLAEAVTSHF
uniref:Uncharacterized protein n=1 Tax=Aegilops tauschii subsp. strangulata TaxID=200361 RepID=A0A453DBJ9_AEGTS